MVPAMTSTVSSINTVVTWAFSSPPPGLPLSIGFCDGQIKVLTPTTWAAAPSYTLTITGTNDGTSIGLGKASTSCSVTVDILQVPLPPVLVTTVFYVSELLPVGENDATRHTSRTMLTVSSASCQFSFFTGTVIGSLSAIDPGNYTITNYSWVALDTPNSFGVSMAGAINVTSIVDTLALAKNTWTYTAQACDPFICGRCAGCLPYSLLVFTLALDHHHPPAALWLQLTLHRFLVHLSSFPRTALSRRAR